MSKVEDHSSSRSTALADLWRCIAGESLLAQGSSSAGKAPQGQASRQRPHRQEPVRINGPVAMVILKRGISSKAIGPLGDFLGVGKAEVAEMLEIDRGTVTRWASKDQPLPTHAAESLLRMVELDQLATETFETEDEARQWLRKPHPMLEDEAPLSAAKTAYGTQRVKDILAAIRYGGVA